MRYISVNSCGAMLFGLLAVWSTAVPGATVEENKPVRTAISDRPWTPTPAPVGPKVIYGTDDRLDVYQETDPVRVGWAASTCGLFSSSDVRDNMDGTYAIQTSAYDVCFDEPFANQPTAAFCTGFMVGEDIIVTAGHCYDTGDLSGVRFVFGFQMEDANTPVLTVAADQVYQGVEVLGRALSGDLDYAVIRVDRPITSPAAEPFELRREGVIAAGDNVGVIGHPSGLPLKIAFGDNTAVRSSSNSGFFVANLDTYGGNSGSPVINPVTGILEGILVRGETDFVLDGNCLRSNVLSNSGGDGEDVSKATTFMQFVPELITGNGVLELNQDAYACSDEIAVTLTDSDLAGSGTVTVDVTAESGDVEMLVLTEVESSGEFTGAITLAGGAFTPGNGTLEAAEGQTVTIAYADAMHEPGAPDTVLAQTAVDCTAPVITAVAITQIGAQYAMVEFTTDEAASGVVRAGTSCGVPDAQASFVAGTSHHVLVSGLLPLTEYFAAIEASDAAGNTSTADNGGACFQFATLETTQYFTEVFGQQVPDLVRSSVTFTPEEGGGYTICRDTITELPVSPTGSTTLVLVDDGFEQVTLANAALFPFYGTDYDRVFVNANGNVTFESGDSSYDATTTVHFGVPRVAPCFMDLDPTSGGSVWHRQLGDRLAVTWQGVPHYADGGANTMQLELFFDGTIRFSYLSLMGQPSIVGLSAGLGVLSDFDSTDLSAQAVCDPDLERYHSADTNQDFVIALQELLRLIQFFNIGGYHCDEAGEDGFAPGPGAQTCTPHDLDYNAQDWNMSLSEVLRLVQLYNSAGYEYDPDQGSEDGFVPISLP